MDTETQAMAQIIEAFKDLDELARSRVLRWAADRFQLSARPTPPSSVVAPVSSGENEARVFSDLASLYDAANPESQADKALVVGYWIQVVGGSEDWESQSVNAELKNLGHGVGNITDVLNTLINQSPRLVIQTRKSGTTKQARKRYRMTTEGIRKLKAMLSRSGAADDK